MSLEDGTTNVLFGLKATPSRIFLEANLRIYCPGFMKVHIMLDCREKHKICKEGMEWVVGEEDHTFWNLKEELLIAPLSCQSNCSWPFVVMWNATVQPNWQCTLEKPAEKP